MVTLKKVIRKTGRTTQYAALCFRLRKGKPYQILLVTSRGTGRWLPPKGWPMKGKSPDKAAAQEALEEAGVKGIVYKDSLGRYRYNRAKFGSTQPSSEAYIFPLQVLSRSNNFREKGQRKVKWFSAKKAARLVREPKLKRLIKSFDPAQLQR